MSEAEIVLWGEAIVLEKECADCHERYMGSYWKSAADRLPPGTILQGRCPSCTETADQRLKEFDRTRRHRFTRSTPPPDAGEPDLRLPLEE